MVSIAVVEDDPHDRETIERYVQEASAAVAEGIKVASFASGQEFVDAYPPGLDIAFLDIDMEGLSGIETARAVRAFDQQVVIVFVTNMYQFALEGYKVRALDFLVKPVRYRCFLATFQRAIDALTTRRPQYVELAFDRAVRLVEVGSILYIETRRKKLVVHTRHGDEFCNGPLKDLEERLAPHGFACPHQSYLVNMSYVEHVGAAEIVVAGTTLPLSRYKRRMFMRQLTDYVGAVV